MYEIARYRSIMTVCCNCMTTTTTALEYSDARGCHVTREKAAGGGDGGYICNNDLTCGAVRCDKRPP